MYGSTLPPQASRECSLSSLRNYGRQSIVLKIMYWLYWLPPWLSQKCKYSRDINLLNLAVYMWLECFGSFLGLQIDAITKWHNAKDSKDTERYPPSQNKSHPTMVSTNTKKEHPMFLASSNPLYTLVPWNLKLGSVTVFVLKKFKGWL